MVLDNSEAHRRWLPIKIALENSPKIGEINPSCGRTAINRGEAMARLSELDDVLFPVSEHPIFVSLKSPSGEKRISVPDKKAIVHGTTSRVLGVVSRSYRLVSNRQALEWAFQCCRTVFPETNSSEWEVKAIDAPSTAGHCCIDLAHNSMALDFSLVSPQGRPDVFGPFIRMTNSYNGLRALVFDIGFLRKICTNGVIIRDAIIQFKFTHMHRDIGEEIQFQVAHDRLAKLKARFGDYVAALRACPVPRKDLAPFVQRVLAIRPPDSLEPNTREANDWDALSAHVADMCNRYAVELGENAYAVFNAVTEFASHPPSNRLVRRERNSLQRAAGEWVSAFSQQCRQPGFDLTRYLASPQTTKAEAA
jgi:hypothetical protein